MLVPYRYVPHQMDKMQGYIDTIFEVWCSAPSGTAYSLDLFNTNAELKYIMEVFRVTDTKGGDFFNLHVELLYAEFSNLDAAQIDQLRDWYNANNTIEQVCENDPAIQAAKYDDVKAINDDFSMLLKKFFMGLYSKDLLDLKVLKDQIGDIDDHHKSFVTTNNLGKCPFCGIESIKGKFHEKREAYDHYLPKSLYPFNAINFRNLVPTCHECNSSYKTTKDPVSLGGVTRKAFYPYAEEAYNIDVTIVLNTTEYEDLSPDDLEIQYGPTAFDEKIETWRHLYGIDERYKAKCCGENDGKYWLTQVIDEWKEDDREPADILVTLDKRAKKNPLAESNFLKNSFLKACDNAGIFEI